MRDVALNIYNIFEHLNTVFSDKLIICLIEAPLFCPCQCWLLSCIAGVLAVFRRASDCREGALCVGLSLFRHSTPRVTGSLSPPAPMRELSEMSPLQASRVEAEAEGGVSCLTVSTLIIKLITYAIYCFCSVPSRVC